MVQTKEPPLNETEAFILSKLRDIRYGSVEVTIHDARVVQVESRHKTRFEKSTDKS